MASASSSQTRAQRPASYAPDEAANVVTGLVSWAVEDHDFSLVRPSTRGSGDGRPSTRGSAGTSLPSTRGSAFEVASADSFADSYGLPELDDLLEDMRKQHPVLARDVCEVVATSPLGAHVRRNLAHARLLPDDALDEFCVQIVEEEQRRRQDLGLDFKEDFRESLPAEERRWKARVVLQRAMHERRLPQLQGSIAEAEASGLYAVEVDYARSIMVEERKAVARVALIDARESRDVGDLQRSISEAQEAMLLPEQIDSTKQALLEEIEKGHSRKDLLSFLKTAYLNPERCIELGVAAVARGEAAGLTVLEMDRAKGTLGVQQRKADARMALARCVRERDVEKLKLAIVEAQMAKLKPTEADMAKEVLKEELRKVAALSQLLRAEIERQGGDVDTFRAAVKEGQLAGLPETCLEGPLKTLANEDLKISARSKLEFATTGGKGGKITKERILEITLEAIQEGETSGLTDDELKGARDMLGEAKKAEAREALQKAIEKRDVAGLWAAIKHGEAVGLSNLAFYDAKQVIMEVEMKVEVLQQLAAALASRKIFALKRAIKEGNSINLPDSDLEPLRVALLDEERKANARNMIKESIKDTIDNDTILKFAKTAAEVEESQVLCDQLVRGLDEAVDKGEVVGLEEREIEPARRAVLELRQWDARRDLKVAEMRRKIPELKAAIAVAKDLLIPEDQIEPAASALLQEQFKANGIVRMKAAIKSRELDELRVAVREGGKACMGTQELALAKKALAEEERCAEARAGLLEAIAGRQMKQLKRWIGIAMAAGLHNRDPPDRRTSQELATSRVVVEEEERKVCAREGLAAAALSHSIAELRAAAREAESAGLEPHEVQYANQTLADELPRAARIALEAALVSRSITGLKAALKEGVAVGLDASEMNQPRLVLGEEQIKEALRRKTAFEIRRAIDDGERYGVDALALENARRVFAVEDKKDKARKQLRDSESSCRVDEIMLAMGAGRAAGLQEWEMEFANRAAEEERRRIRLMNTSTRLVRSR